MQGSPPQLRDFLSCTGMCCGVKFPLSEAAPLSFTSSVSSWGSELSLALVSGVPWSPHPAWLTRDAFGTGAALS